MEVVIKRILDMDQKGQEMARAAQQEKLSAEKEIAENAAALRERYLRQAQNRVQINAENDHTIMEQTWRRRKARYEQQKAAMEAAFQQKGTEWAETLAQRVLADDRDDGLN